MLLTTTGDIPGYRVEQVIGLVRGSTIRARNVGRDIIATFRNLVGGEVTEYTRLLAESRNQAIERMTAQAEREGANAVIGLRFTTSQVMANAAEIMVYGTAVVVSKE